MDPDAWLEDARQGATPGQCAPQPLGFRVYDFRMLRVLGVLVSYKA